MNTRFSLNAVARSRAALLSVVLVAALGVAAPAQACARYVTETVAYDAHIPTCSYVLNVRAGTRAYNKAIRYLDRVGYDAAGYIYRTSGRYPELCRA